MTSGRRDLVLYVVAVVLACACVVGGVLSWHHHQQRQDAAADPSSQPPSRTEQERYGAVQKAADTTALAMLNIDYRDPQKSVEAVSATSTGQFLTQYHTATDPLLKLIKQYRSVLSSTIVSTAVSDVDADSATVLVATNGKVSNAQTGNRSTVRNFRLVLGLTLVKGQWRTNSLEFAS